MASGKKPVPKQMQLGHRIGVCLTPLEGRKLTKLAHDQGMRASGFVRVTLKKELGI